MDTCFGIGVVCVSAALWCLHIAGYHYVHALPPSIFILILSCYDQVFLTHKWRSFCHCWLWVLVLAYVAVTRWWSLKLKLIISSYIHTYGMCTMCAFHLTGYYGYTSAYAIDVHQAMPSLLEVLNFHGIVFYSEKEPVLTEGRSPCRWAWSCYSGYRNYKINDMPPGGLWVSFSLLLRDGRIRWTRWGDNINYPYIIVMWTCAHRHAWMGTGSLLFQRIEMMKGSLFDNFTWYESYLANVSIRCSSPPHIELHAHACMLNSGNNIMAGSYYDWPYVHVSVQLSKLPIFHPWLYYTSSPLLCGC